jgi:hypothetical protein
MGKEIIECNHGALARVCDRCEAENEKYRLAAEIERLRDLVESAYREGWEDGFENDAHSQDRNWKSSHAFRALKEGR